MEKERTLSLLKPDAVKRHLTGKINQRFEDAGLSIIAQRRLTLTYAQAQHFYNVHKHRPFFDELCTIISSGPIVAQVLEGKNAIACNRALMGATDPKAADAGTIRADFALSIAENTVHGSDSKETAAQEIAFFFPGMELMG